MKALWILDNRYGEAIGILAREGIHATADRPDLGEPVITAYNPGCGYDPHTMLARRRRTEGLCGLCGHPTHNRKIGCQVCGPEGCPVILEIWGDAAIEASAKMERAQELADEDPDEYMRRCRAGEEI